MRATLYYRGSLSSCNYDCPYCPFSKNKDSAETLARDRKQLAQFMEWVRKQEADGHQLSIFFNPYGEALVHRAYREAMVELSHLPHIEKVAIQTNLSVKLDWTARLNREKAAFWVTYHPGETREAIFVKQCMSLYEKQIPFSVGSVGVKSAFAAISSLRSQLPEDVYLWVNAFKDAKNYYSAADLDFLRSIDPHFTLNLNDYDSYGRPCEAGSSVFYVQGSGLVKRCYKDRTVIGHLYRSGLAGLAKPRLCQMACCDCYIGYIHMPELELKSVYGDNLLERIAKTQALARTGAKETTTI